MRTRFIEGSEGEAFYIRQRLRGITANKDVDGRVKPGHDE
jgi:hypothetical protein